MGLVVLIHSLSTLFSLPYEKELFLCCPLGMEKTYCSQLEYMTNYFKEVNFYIYAGPAARIRARNVPEDYFTCKCGPILTLSNQYCRKQTNK